METDKLEVIVNRLEEIASDLNYTPDDEPPFDMDILRRHMFFALMGIAEAIQLIAKDTPKC
ncbi:MAG: hypothetical protein ACYCSH_16415 [Acidithiobacillus sp.]